MLYHPDQPATSTLALTPIARAKAALSLETIERWVGLGLAALHAGDPALRPAADSEWNSNYITQGTYRWHALRRLVGYDEDPKAEHERFLSTIPEGITRAIANWLSGGFPGRSEEVDAMVVEMRRAGFFIAHVDMTGLADPDIEIELLERPPGRCVLYRSSALADVRGRSWSPDIETALRYKEWQTLAGLQPRIWVTNTEMANVLGFALNRDSVSTLERECIIDDPGLLEIRCARTGGPLALIEEAEQIKAATRAAQAQTFVRDIPELRFEYPDGRVEIVPMDSTSRSTPAHAETTQ